MGRCAGLVRVSGELQQLVAAKHEALEQLTQQLRQQQQPAASEAAALRAPSPSQRPPRQEKQRAAPAAEAPAAVGTQRDTEVRDVLSAHALRV